MVISLTSLREKLFYSIPESLRYGISIGIGLFILALGLSNLGILSYTSQVIVIGDGSWATQIIGAGTFESIFTLANLLALVCFAIILVLMKKNVKGNILIGIIVTYIIGVILELAGYPVLPDQSLIPTTIISSDLGGSLGAVAFKFGDATSGFTSLKTFIDFAIIAITFLVISLFDTMVTLTALTTKVDGYDENGKIPRLRKILSVDALGPMIGSALGTSPVIVKIAFGKFKEISKAMWTLFAFLVIYMILEFML